MGVYRSVDALGGLFPHPPPVYTHCDLPREGIWPYVGKTQVNPLVMKGAVTVAQLKLLLVDDQTLLVDALRVVLDLESDFMVVGTAGNGWQAIEETLRLEPDVVLLDIQMGGMDGLESLKRIKTARPDTKVIMLTTFADDMYIVMSLVAGADGFLLKDVKPDEVVAVIRQVAQGYMVLPAAIALRVARQLAPLAPSVHGPLEQIAMAGGPAPALSKREQEIAGLMANGLTNMQIAQRLHLTGGTVKNYVSTIYEKLGTNERGLAVARLRQQ